MAAIDPDVLYVSGLVAAIFRSPTWVAPIAQFVDENCGTFKDQEENKLEYTLIHNAFKQLVDELLEAHLQDLSVSQEVFTRFCHHGLTGDNEFHRELVEQLLSVDDFMIFKAMMVKRSAQLYRQAMEMSSHLVVHSACADPGFGEALAPGAQLGSQDDDELLAAQQRLEVVELEAEKVELQRKCVEAELQLAMALSLQLKKRLQLMEALTEVLEALAEMKEGAEQALAAEAAAAAPESPILVQPLYVIADTAQAPQQAAPLRAAPRVALAPLAAPAAVQPMHVLTSPAHSTFVLESPAPAADDAAEAAAMGRQRERAKRAMEASKQAAESKAAEARAAVAAPPVPTEEERRNRAEHLKQQRDLLLQKKNKEREQQLDNFKQSNGRTAAARVAEEALARPQVAPPMDAGKRLAAELSGAAAAPPDPAPQKDAHAAEMRKMLTRQLKQTLTSSMQSS